MYIVFCMDRQIYLNEEGKYRFKNNKKKHTLHVVKEVLKLDYIVKIAKHLKFWKKQNLKLWYCIFDLIASMYVCNLCSIF